MHLTTFESTHREDTEVSRDKGSGDVFAEILVKSKDGLIPVVASFTSPWPLGKKPKCDRCAGM